MCYVTPCCIPTGSVDPASELTYKKKKAENPCVAFIANISYVCILSNLGTTFVQGGWLGANNFRMLSFGF